jgi:lipopolysaccharide/colanic/teichoic acid biosynthesis glycosyltransferase
VLEAKRLVDIVVGGIGALVTAPVVMALGAAVRLDSPGPALYVQTRVGRGGRPIRIAKLRTMVVHDPAGGPQITSAGDRRVTRVGALLRATKLDELPQLWSVVKGDMSLVGPRPEVPKYVSQYRPEWRAILDVRPGITDEASLAFRREEQLLALARDRERAYVDVIMPLKIKLALDGAAERSVLADLSVLARTVLALLPGRGDAEHPAAVEARQRIATLG